MKYDEDHIYSDTSDLHHILCPLILEAPIGHVIFSCKALMRKKSIEGFVVLFVHSNITIIDHIIWRTALLKKIKKKKAPSRERKKKSLDYLLYDSNNDKSHSPLKELKERKIYRFLKSLRTFARKFLLDRFF